MHYILNGKENHLIVCQSNATNKELEDELALFGYGLTINPLGEWTGGTNVDTGATNRKLGSDMGRAVTGGGLHGKDLSKADVSVNIVCHMMAQETGLEIEALCAIGDKAVLFRREDGETAMVPYEKVVERAGEYIKATGGFEKLAEWGLF